MRVCGTQVKESLEGMMGAVIALMQITAEQRETWESDANQFINDGAPPTHTHIHTYTRAHTGMHAHARTHTHPHTYTRTHTHTHTRTHTNL